MTYLTGKLPSAHGVQPGDPARSLLIQFIESARGEARRMPQSGQPLSVQQIALVRGWVAEGARDDGPVAPDTTLVRDNVSVSPEYPVQIVCRVDTPRISWSAHEMVVTGVSYGPRLHLSRRLRKRRTQPNQAV